MKSFNSALFSNFDYAKNLEWLETNGLGGYASSSVAGANTRKYHGLLVASTNPPVGRMTVVSKLDETVVTEGNRYELSSNQYPDAVHPQGHKFIKTFQRDIFPVFHYQAGAVELKKTIAAVHGENTTLILYEVTNASEKFTLEFLPLYACRDFHGLSHANESIGQHYLFENGVLRTMNYQGCPEFFISVPGSAFTEHKDWYYNLEYSAEQYRGLNFREDLYTHGKFTVGLAKGDKLGVVISTEDAAGRDAFKLFAKEKKRREGIVKNYSSHNQVNRLALAADQFIVKRGEFNTIIAGYPWFADWGRDTMISLPGLCLATGRFSDAKKILQAFAARISDGMLPNRFPDYGETPEYNTVDASLWFFQAIYKYYTLSKDSAFIKSLLPILKDSIEWHYKGTRYNIKVDASDELLCAGQEGVQLTWMDAKVGDWVVTPRRGKAVEINALWYNALKVLAYLLEEVGENTAGEIYNGRAAKVFTSFTTLFWNEKLCYLYDYIDGEIKNDDLRPNQLYAISLSFPLLAKEKAKLVLKAATDFLLTPKGLRSLSPLHKDYRPVYCGDVWSRDAAYHQGTAWSFLLGAYIDTLVYVEGDAGKIKTKALLEEFFNHLDEAGVGTVSEIFDGEKPNTPRGCIAQAWGVAEVLRVIAEYELYENNSFVKHAMTK